MFGFHLLASISGVEKQGQGSQPAEERGQDVPSLGAVVVAWQRSCSVSGQSGAEAGGHPSGGMETVPERGSRVCCSPESH